MLKRFAVHAAGVFAFGLVLIGSAQAKVAEIPLCAAKNGGALSIDNNRVLELKRTTPNQFLERARVEGRITRIFDGNPEHQHFEIQIGSQAGEVIELVFNQDFGRPVVKVGDEVEACGDYITSNAPTDRYQASPSGAIVHWLHENSRGGGHPDGYIVVNDRLMYGFGRLPLEVQADDAKSDSVTGTPAEDRKASPAPAPSRENERRSKREKKRRPYAGKDDPEYQRLPRHGRNWRDRIDEDRT